VYYAKTYKYASRPLSGQFFVIATIFLKLFRKPENNSLRKTQIDLFTIRI